MTRPGLADAPVGDTHPSDRQSVGGGGGAFSSALPGPSRWSKKHVDVGQINRGQETKSDPVYTEAGQ